MPDFGVHLRQRLEVQPESVFVGQPRVRCHHQVRKVLTEFGHAFREVNGGATPPLQSGAPPPPPPPASVPLEDLPAPSAVGTAQLPLQELQEQAERILQKKPQPRRERGSGVKIFNVLKVIDYAETLPPQANKGKCCLIEFPEMLGNRKNLSLGRWRHDLKRFAELPTSQHYVKS